MRRYLVSIVGFPLLHGPASEAADIEQIAVGHFSHNTPALAIPLGWQPYRLGKARNETHYRLVSVDGRTVLEARAENSASALVYPLRADPKRTSWLSFSWRTERLVEKSDMRTTAGDDYPARIYVIFDYDIARLSFGERIKLRMARSIWGDQVPAAALCYVWEPRQPVGHSQWSAYTTRLRMIVAESGGARLDQWVSIERNVAEDFRAAFGEEPPPISAVIVATDTDNTGETAHTWFGDISLRSKPYDGIAAGPAARKE